MPGKKIAATEIYALAFGLFLGLTIWKFGNPVILDQKITPPVSFAEFWNDAWPTHWARWIFWPLAIAGAILAFAKNPRWPATKWLWLLPLAWFGWQIFSARQTVDADLTSATLWQYAGCVASYFLGAFLFRNGRARNLLLAGILAAFTFCLVRAIDQRLFEFPQSHQMLVEGEHTGWTNTPPEMLLEMKREQVVITTNGADVANPAILAKFAKGRVMGTLVYPNALAGAILLLFPISLALAFGATKNLKRAIRFAAIALTIFLGVAAFFWTGSKLGWLIGLGIAGIFLLRFNRPKSFKLAAIVAVLILGLGIFAVRFHSYFAAGATSVGARFDYWRAALQTTAANPLLGSGPGTFQRPYAKLKSPEAEMARLAHNDYLEQFSDSGITGGIAYAAWISLALATIGKRVRKSGDSPAFAIFLGLLGWFLQGLGEFGLFIPALAWTAFTLLGCSIGREINGFDKKAPKS
jgi:O-antigen ligase